MSLTSAMAKLLGMGLSNLDLNLLVSLDALLDQRSVTRAAQQPGLSRPAGTCWSIATCPRRWNGGSQPTYSPGSRVTCGRITRVSSANSRRIVSSQPTFSGPYASGSYLRVPGSRSRSPSHKGEVSSTGR